MNLTKGTIYFPKSRKQGKVRYLSICAHQDDNEIMAIDGIIRGYRARKYAFACITTTNGCGSPRKKEYLDMSEEDFINLRNEEQTKAAEIGRYHSLYFLNYTSEEVKDQENENVVNDYLEILKALKPSIIYTHSILDRHPTHVAVAVKVINAIRKLPKSERPKVLYGCEVWRTNDWVSDKKRILFNNSRNIRFQKSLINVYKSQISESKQYANAAIGRRIANVTFNDSSKLVNAKLASSAIIMTPLIKNIDLPIKKFACSFVEDLFYDVQDMMDRSL